MNASRKLDQYLESFRARLRKLTLLQGAAATASVLLLLSVIGAWFSADSGFASNTTNVFRIILILGLAAVVVRFLVDPLQKLKQGISAQVEKRTPGFDGRIETYAQMKESNNPFTDLLAEDALKISATHQVEQQVRNKELQIAGGVLAAAVLVFLYLLVAGPNLLNYSMRNLLAGWAFNDLLPPQSIEVTPGDESVRRGANVRVTAVMEGFNPDEATIHITNADGNTQEVGMVESPLGFEFTFFSLQQNMSYYVAATGLRSPEFDISVLDVPGIESLSLTYNYPEWTERDPETFDQGDVRALPETRIALTVTTTAPLSEGELVLNSTGQTLALNGNQASSEFTVMEEGEYYIAAIVGGEHVRISDDYFIRLTEDGKPELKIVKPGGDYNASNIEEVELKLDASDDYGIAALALKYSVNGGEFQSIDLTQENSRTINAEHLFMLEDMRTEATRAVTANVGQFTVVLDEGSVTRTPEPSSGPEIRDEVVRSVAEADAANAIEQIQLQPGDLISYYAEASDRGQTVRTDMFFIQIQPYNRRYSQSQLSGGGGGGGGGQQQDEISQRQRQIIVSTWNLIREQAEGENTGQVDINSKLLSELQITLAEQAATLAERTRARQLDGDEQIEEFVNNMEQAVQHMHPASEQLAEVNLDDAIQPAQEALQYLLRAESVFNDITVNQQQGGGGGGGGRASQDLAEMYELEMDLELNQYETGNQASQQSQQQQAEDIMQKLDELAKRQEQLANNLRNQQQLTDAQRWQQDMLRREAEELQEQLEQLQRQQASQQQGQQQGQQQASNQPGQQGQQGETGQQGSQGQAGGQPGEPGQQAGENGEQGGEQAGEQIAQSELQRRMESAIRAMNQASEGLNGNSTPEEMQRAADEAQRQLEEARDQVAQEQLAGMQQSFTNMAAQSEEMLQAQQGMEEQLQAAMETAVKERESGADPNSRGMSLQEEMELAEAKRQLAAQLQQLQQAMMNTQQNFGEQVPDAATDELQRASNGIAESELEQAISDAALYIDAGYGLYIAGNESAVTAGMRDLEQRLERAQEMVEQANAPGDSELDRARRTAQDLRAQLEQLAQGGQPGEGQQGGQRNGGGIGDRFGFGGPRDDTFFDGPINLPDDFYDDVGNLTQLARDVAADIDMTPEELAELYDLIRELEFQQTNRNESILAQEYGEMLALIEQLEVGLTTGSDSNKPSNVRTATSDEVPEEFQDSVAEYFRRLSRE